MNVKLHSTSFCFTHKQNQPPIFENYFQCMSSKRVHCILLTKKSTGVKTNLVLKFHYDWHALSHKINGIGKYCD